MVKEYVHIVDSHDNPLEIKERENVTDTDIIRVSALWVEDGRGNVLIQQRAYTKSLGAGLWQPAVAGTVESHESYVDNIKKEAAEEIGLTDIDPTPVMKRYNVDLNGTYGRIVMFYLLVCDKPLESFTLEIGQAEQLKWIDKQALFHDIEARPSKYVSSAAVWQTVYA